MEEINKWIVIRVCAIATVQGLHATCAEYICLSFFAFISYNWLWDWWKTIDSVLLIPFLFQRQESFSVQVGAVKSIFSTYRRFYESIYSSNDAISSYLHPKRIMKAFASLFRSYQYYAAQNRQNLLRFWCHFIISSCDSFASVRAHGEVIAKTQKLKILI